MGGGSDFYAYDRNPEFERRMYDMLNAFRRDSEGEKKKTEVWCGSCAYRINPNGSVAWCAKHKDKLVKLLDKGCDLYKRGPALRTEVTDPVPAYRSYRSWKELLQEPEDMTSREKFRLTRIKLIPETIRKSISQREQELREEIKRLERELDQLCDFLNGEWDPAPEISSKERSVGGSSIEFKKLEEKSE